MTLEAVQHAARVHSTRSQLNREQLVNEAIALGEWGVYSNRHIGALTGLRPAFVNELTGKRDKTGGTMNPDALGTVAEVIVARTNGEDVKERVKALLEDGFSGVMVARLTGIPATTVNRWGAQ